MNDSIELHENDLCAIITKDGEFVKIISQYNDDEIYSEADLIHEFMIEAMKDREAREGIWVWRIDEDLETMYADYIDEYE